jgi:inactivated superfamily I helicase
MNSLPRTDDHVRYTMPDLVDLRRKMLRFARLFPVGPERNERRQIAMSLRQLFENKARLAAHTTTEMISMQKFFFDMKDGVPMRDQIGIEFNTNAEAILHCKELVQRWRDGSLRDDKDLEISVVNSFGREIHREFVHRDLPS